MNIQLRSYFFAKNRENGGKEREMVRREPTAGMLDRICVGLDGGVLLSFGSKSMLEELLETKKVKLPGESWGQE